MKLYKLTDENDQTRNNTQWGKNVTHEGTGKGELCGPGWIHAYTDPLLAILLNPNQGNFDEQTMHLWVGEGEIDKTNHGLKVGCKKFTTIKRMRKPKVTLTQKIAFGILCALEGDTEASYVQWAKNWLNGTDRSSRAVAAVAYAAYDAAEAAAHAKHAAYSAAHAAEAAAHDARAADAEIDLIALAKKAMTYA